MKDSKRVFRFLSFCLKYCNLNLVSIKTGVKVSYLLLKNIQFFSWNNLAYLFEYGWNGELQKSTLMPFLIIVFACQLAKVYLFSIDFHLYFVSLGH